MGPWLPITSKDPQSLLAEQLSKTQRINVMFTCFLTTSPDPLGPTHFCPTSEKRCPFTLTNFIQFLCMPLRLQHSLPPMKQQQQQRNTHSEIHSRLSPIEDGHLMTGPSGRNRSDGHELWPPRLAGRRAPGGQRCAQRAGRVSEARRGRQWRPNR